MLANCKLQPYCPLCLLDFHMHLCVCIYIYISCGSRQLYHAIALNSDELNKYSIEYLPQFCVFNWTKGVSPSKNSKKCLVTWRSLRIMEMMETTMIVETHEWEASFLMMNDQKALSKFQEILPIALVKGEAKSIAKLTGFQHVVYFYK